MVVVEGCDGAGKSTLVNHLCDKFGLKIGQRGVANRDELYKVTRQDTYRALSEAVLGRETFVWDRLFVSEFVYAGLVGRPCEFSIYERQFIVDVMNALEFPMIVCLPPWEVVEENANKVHQMKGVKENLYDIYLVYHSGDLPWPENTLWYDYTGATPHFATLADIEEEVEGYLNEKKERQAWS